ncbi:methyltransferase domain-containing protein [candidate division KSB1 bacterium]|nr:methyltransferase domain-containing protein [candidate division KSB1 bacterium]
MGENMMSSHLDTWNNYARFSEARARLVIHLLEKYLSLDAARILDIGCGGGSTAQLLADRGARVQAIDISNNVKSSPVGWHFSLMAGENPGFKNGCFDAVILQDALEHCVNPAAVLAEAGRILKNDGVLFMNTPNRLSPINFISDPHWHLPVVSLLPRRSVILFVRNIFLKDRRERRDWAALLSLFRLKKLFSKSGFEMSFENRTVAGYLFREPDAVVCSRLHLKMVTIFKKLRFDKLIPALVNDRHGIFNYLVNPTWYIIGQKRNEKVDNHETTC